MILGYDRPLYMLAFDHRGSFQKGLFGAEGVPSPAVVEQVADAKRVIWEGLELALESGADPASSGLLVDEQFGAGVARAARAAGLPLAMPVEQSGREEFDFEYGERFGDHIEDFDPTFAKVLVRYNLEAEGDLNRRQAERLALLGSWLRERECRYLFELLVPATDEQLRRVGNDGGRYDRELRPGLVVSAIAELQQADVEPDIWKIEGLDAREDCERVAAQARSGGRDGVACIVLGRGADESQVVRWLQEGAGVPGYVGFAVGRTLWWHELEAYVARTLPRAEAADRIAANYLRMVDAYAAATAR